MVDKWWTTLTECGISPARVAIQSKKLEKILQQALFRARQKVIPIVIPKLSTTYPHKAQPSKGPNTKAF
ncbi:hypothetical protein C0J27_03285 [Candidatus Chromulinivorax destructor]|uniref:Uncharacterized protein n=1 Tax=Candidatus Chromulinivorax destructor TaxID=2066483 RepID=A0A345ZBT6_9BACT|nr:hypothetical protein C0J27_03285 [Candidatus Chromulinivorax destructor]